MDASYRIRRTFECVTTNATLRQLHHLGAMYSLTSLLHCTSQYSIPSLAPPTPTRSVSTIARHAGRTWWPGFVYSFHSLLAVTYCEHHGGYSSVGRASDCGSEGRAFEPRYPPPHKPAGFRRACYVLQAGHVRRPVRCASLMCEVTQAQSSRTHARPSPSPPFRFSHTFQPRVL